MSNTVEDLIKRSDSLIKKLNLPKINTCRCKGLPFLNSFLETIICSRCGAKSNKFFDDKDYETRLLKIINSWNEGKYADWQDEQYYSCMSPFFLSKKKSKLKSYKFYSNLLNKIQKEGKTISFFYKDQAPSSINVYDRNIFSMLLEPGIKKIDTWYSLRIRELGSKDARFPKISSKELEDAILKNIHLHDLIKANLIFNLKNYQKHEKVDH